MRGAATVLERCANGTKCGAARGAQKVAARRPASYMNADGEVPEWSNGTVSKTVVRATVPWVRIPPSPPITQLFFKCLVETRPFAVFSKSPCVQERCKRMANGRFLNRSDASESRSGNPPSADSLSMSLRSALRPNFGPGQRTIRWRNGPRGSRAALRAAENQ
jgi:hypothetical protein